MYTILYFLYMINRGSPILNDDAYGILKAELQQEGSWVVNRLTNYYNIYLYNIL